MSRSGRLRPAPCTTPRCDNNDGPFREQQRGEDRPENIVPRIATGYRALSYSVAATRLTVEFDGGLFEMEDQRNWTDNTFKSYTPPLSDPRPLHLRKDQVLTYAVRVTGEAPHRAVQGARRRRSSFEGDGPSG